eukprot:2943668-Alexandrium_andersonii.AAC.1
MGQDAAFQHFAFQVPLFGVSAFQRSSVPAVCGFAFSRFGGSPSAFHRLGVFQPRIGVMLAFC